MGLLASLIKDIIRKLISWFRSGNRKISTFIDSVKKAIKSFVSNLKEHLLNAGNTLVTTIATAIFGPVIGMIKKAWIFLKQGYKSIKQAIKFLKDPANKNMPFSIKMMEVGKIVIVGLTAGGAIVLSEVIEKGLMSIPGFAFEIPLLGSLASLVGMFLGALVSGLIGALALNLIDRIISKKLKRINEKQQIDKRNDILVTQDKLIKVVEVKAGVTREKVTNNIKERHENAAESIKSSIERIKKNSEEINKPLAENAEIVEEDIESENEDSINKIFSDLNDM
jgi:gas vesicle protein